MMTQERLSALLRQRWAALGERTPPPQRLSFLMITKGNEPVGKIVLLAFADGERRPRFIIKIARLKEQNRALEAEGLNLDMVAPYARHGRVLVPQVLQRWEEEGRVCLVESFVEGPDLWQATARARSDAYVAPIVEWLIHLGQTTGGLPPRGNGAEDLIHLVDGAVRHATTDEQRRVLERVSRLLLTLEGAPLPRVFEQRDMGTWNLMVSPTGMIGVLDWESARAGGFPAWDLFYFLAHYGFMMHGARDAKARLDSFQDVFLSRESGFAATARSAVRRYTEAMGFGSGWLGPLFVGCWLHHTLSEVARLGFTLSDSFFWHMLTMTLDHQGRPTFLEEPPAS
jgi:hypothetical protein